ncbi:hypothetical protein GCM10010275_66940 [Streptomyces litmocidini]|uniref:alpha/beta hydrolase n=1 Tax=Streptomyces litmocidini TaxID=67318 RepID=UPI0019B80633|nr:alpha/beta hydrolase [Streptomyces litmocidini]GGV16100.1 hypothetical protein GCM10010275_66940 [Streptomyces litmocidini]
MRAPLVEDDEDLRFGVAAGLPAALPAAGLAADGAAGVCGASGVTGEPVREDRPASTRRPHRVRAPGVLTVFVVGTTGDPATPCQEAVGPARRFPGGVPPSFEAPGHTGYGRDACVDEKVEE